MSAKKVKIGFDLDGVVIGKPFFVPQLLMEKLVREKVDHQLSYRYPKSVIEKKIRIFSHHPILRPPIKDNIVLIKELYKSNMYEIYVVSSRYSFLERRTNEWFKFYNLRKFFKEIFINLEDEQPHIFKEKMIKKLKLNVFIDDDKPLLKFLKSKTDGVELIYVSDQKKRFSQK
jgi:hypothetical protein